MALLIIDLALVLGATLRLTRLVTTDDLGLWLLRRPAYRWASTMEPRENPVFPWAESQKPDFDRVPYDPAYEGTTRRQRLVSGLDCPFCVGFWLGVVVLGTLAVCGGPGDASTHAATLWRYVAGAFTLNYIAAHISARLDGDMDGSTE